MTGETPFETEERVIRQARERQHPHEARNRRPPVFAILAAILAGCGFLLQGVQAHTGPWDSPIALGLAALACLAVHLTGFPNVRQK